MSNDYQLFKRYLKRDWYVQGFSAVPLFLSTAAISGTFMKRYLGFGYRHFLFSYHDGYGEMAYDPADFKHVWRMVKRRLKADPTYLKKIKALYFRNLRRYQSFLKKLQPAILARVSDQELLVIFQQLILAQVDYVGVAHIIDAIGMEIEGELRQHLGRELPPSARSRFNEIFSALITPSRPSFVSQEEQALLAIRGGVKNQAALERHATKYFWLQNSYAGPKNMTVADFKKRLVILRREKTKAATKTKIKFPFRLSPELKALRAITDYCAVWQDERKALIFKNISYTGFVLKELARRLKKPLEYFCYLSLSEVRSLHSLADLKGMIKILQERKQGCLIVIYGMTDKVISGHDYKRLLNGRHRLIKQQDFVAQELHGTVANIGTAIGTVRIIKNLSSLKDFAVGDILVASMTRPEFMPAIKKAAAIVTDEGGVTCHAAIIARELNIPTIIGTRIATQVLKDGMKIEVRANHGIVRIIN
ncbi:MAG: PEP-utilizing enzyme [Patescibacteria group bacterium]